jgi:hypothetical protein
MARPNSARSAGVARVHAWLRRTANLPLPLLRWSAEIGFDAEIILGESGLTAVAVGV